MRSMLRRYSGTQMVSNFRPTAAAAMYNIFCDVDSPLEGTTAGTVWDPSMGYGGRLLGAITAGVNYIGTDPCIPCLLYTSPSPRDRQKSRMPSSA